MLFIIIYNKFRWSYCRRSLKRNSFSNVRFIVYWFANVICKYVMELGSTQNMAPICWWGGTCNWIFSMSTGSDFCISELQSKWSLCKVCKHHFCFERCVIQWPGRYVTTSLANYVYYSPSMAESSIAERWLRSDLWSKMLCVIHSIEMKCFYARRYGWKYLGAIFCNFFFFFFFFFNFDIFAKS